MLMLMMGVFVLSFTLFWRYRFPKITEDGAPVNLSVRFGDDEEAVSHGGITSDLAANTASLNSTKGSMFSLSVTEDMIETFQAHLPDLLGNYKNPCWYEDVPAEFDYTKSYYYLWSCFASRHVVPPFRQLQREKAKKRLRCYPSFYVLGFAKAGTSNLFKLVTTHVQGLKRGLVKETNYWTVRRFGELQPFCVDSRYSGEKAQFSDFLNLYDPAAQRIERKAGESTYHSSIIGDFTPTTGFIYPKWRTVIGNEGLSEPKYTVAHHLHGVYPKTKFIFVMRNPMTRARSHYRFFDDPEGRGFSERLSSEMGVFNRCMAEHNNPRTCAYDLSPSSSSGMLTWGLYYIFLKDWLEVFPREQIHIIRTDDFAADTAGVLEGVADFIGLKLKKGSFQKLQNMRPHKTKTASATKQNASETSSILREFYAPWNQKLADLLGDKKWALWNTLDESETI